MDQRDSTILSEDPHAGYATPVMDIVAAGVLAAISIWMMVESLRLPVPGGIATAPGLLPFLTAASLLVMAVSLGAMAVLRRRRLGRSASRFELPAEFPRSLGLGAILIVYVAALDLAVVEASFTIGSLRFFIGAFEVITVIALSAILRIYWGAALWICSLISFGWIAFLSVIFRMIFVIQLP